MKHVIESVVFKECAPSHTIITYMKYVVYRRMTRLSLVTKLHTVDTLMKNVSPASTKNIRTQSVLQNNISINSFYSITYII